MKGKFWRKALAVATSVLMLSGGVPIQPLSQVFDRTAITASAAKQTVEKTVMFKMDGGDSGETTLLDDNTLYTTAGGANNTLHWTCNDPNPYNNPQIMLVNSTFFGDHYAHTYFVGDVLNSNPSVEFLDIEGKITKVEMVNFQLAGDGVQMFVGKDSSDTSTLLHLQDNANDYDFHSIGGLEGQETYSSATFVGNVNVDINNPLKILFIGTVTDENRYYGCNFDFKSDGSGYISVTYETEEEVTGDPGHSFSYTTSGDTLTATCNQTDPNHNCGLTDHKATLKLSADDVPYNGLIHTASVNKQEFVNATGITDITTTFSYKNKATNEVRTNGEYEIGDYTVTATITISGTAYTLTKDFSISENTHSITNNCSGLYLNRTTARPFDEVHITVAPGVNPNSLSVVGATTNLTLDNHGIWFSQNGYYWFQMPDEDVTVNAGQTDYSISVSDSIEHGSVAANVGETENAATAHYRDPVTLIVTPDTGYAVKSVKVGNEVITPVNGVYSFEMPAGDVTVTAEFKRVFSDGIGERLMGYSVSLDGDIGVNFYMELDDSVAANENAYMQFTLPNGDTPKVPVSEAAQKTVGGKTYYVFKCNVAAKEMTDTITAQMIDGEKSGKEYTYSVKDYADYLLDRTEENEEYEKAAPLVKAMLDYGKYSQIYFDHNAEALANGGTDSTDIQEVDADTIDKPYNPNGTYLGDVGDTTFEGATLSLKSETTLSLYFKSSTDLRFEWDSYEVEKDTTADGYQIARIRGIKADDLDETFGLYIYDAAETGIIRTFAGNVEYCPLTYCYNVLNGGSDDENLQNVCRALYLYWQAANEYSE